MIFILYYRSLDLSTPLLSECEQKHDKMEHEGIWAKPLMDPDACGTCWN